MKIKIKDRVLLGVVSGILAAIPAFMPLIVSLTKTGHTILTKILTMLASNLEFFMVPNSLVRSYLLFLQVDL